MKRILLAGALCAILSGCYTLRTEISRGYGDDYRDNVYLSQAKGSYDRQLNETENVAFIFWGLGTAKQSNPNAVLGKYLDKGYKISNLRITTERTFVDSLISSLTFGLYNPWTVRYEGDIIKVNTR